MKDEEGKSSVQPCDGPSRDLKLGAKNEIAPGGSSRGLAPFFWGNIPAILHSAAYINSIAPVALRGAIMARSGQELKLVDDEKNVDGL
jgi:hypothetical protein